MENTLKITPGLSAVRGRGHDPISCRKGYGLHRLFFGLFFGLKGVTQKIKRFTPLPKFTPEKSGVNRRCTHWYDCVRGLKFTPFLNSEDFSRSINNFVLVSNIGHKNEKKSIFLNCSVCVFRCKLLLFLKSHISKISYI